MKKKVNWAAADKRIRERRTGWTADELKRLDEQLKKLPDQAENFDILEVDQPALAPPEDLAPPETEESTQAAAN